MRLDRLLASLALGSREQVKVMVRRGRVSVDGQPVSDPALKVDAQAEIALDGAPLDTRLERHVMMNKPAGLLTAARDSRQPTVMGLLPGVYASLGCMPVGRLDKDTEGLLLFTTDGSAAHRLLSPRHGVPKVYRARVTGRLHEGTHLQFDAGIVLHDFTALPAALEILEASDSESLALVTVQEGKFHQVRRMFSACGHEVLHLKRLRFGTLPLDDALAPGQWRELTTDEWRGLTEDGRDNA